MLESLEQSMAYGHLFIAVSVFDPETLVGLLLTKLNALHSSYKVLRLCPLHPELESKAAFLELNVPSASALYVK